MRLAEPGWLWMVLPIGLLFFARIRFQGDFALPCPDLSLFQSVLRTNRRQKLILESLRALFFLCLLIALARPQKVQSVKELPQPVRDILLCLDTSLSMAALDFDPDNRLEQAKKSAEEFIAKRPLDRIGLVVFGGRAVIQCPLTLDHSSLVELLRTVPLNATETEGTAIGTALALSASRLAESTAKSKIIILLTDGRSNTGSIDPLTAASAAAELGIKIYAIGTAVPGGGLLPVEDPLFGRRLVRMTEDLDESTLLEIARLTNAKYFRVTSEKKFKEIYDEIDRMEKTEIPLEMNLQTKELYLPFLLLGLCTAFLLLFLEEGIWRTFP